MKSISLSDSLKIFLLIAAIVLAILLYFDKCNKTNTKEKELVSLINAMNDKLKTYIDKDSSQRATISVLKTEKTRDFLEIQTKDSEILHLQAVVKQYKAKLSAGSSVTNASVETNVNHTGTTTITKVDTIKGKDSIAYVYPTYSDSIINKWITYRATADKDSFRTSIKIKNDFSVIVGTDKGKPFVDLITQNPYSETKQLRTYQVSIPKPKKFGVGPNVSYGVGVGFKPQVFIGIGIQYNILRL